MLEGRKKKDNLKIVYNVLIIFTFVTEEILIVWDG